MYDREFEDFYKLFEWEEHEPLWPLYRSPDAITVLKERAASYGGYIAVSSFLRAFQELKSEGAIRQIRQPKPVVPDEPELTAADYFKIPASQVTFRYKRESEFKAQVNALIARGEI